MTIQKGPLPSSQGPEKTMKNTTDLEGKNSESQLQTPRTRIQPTTGAERQC